MSAPAAPAPPAWPDFVAPSDGPPVTLPAFLARQEEMDRALPRVRRLTLRGWR